MVERQKIDQRSKAQPFRPLRERGHEQTGRGRQPQRCSVVLGEMVGMKAETIVGFDQLHAIFDLLAERHAAVVHVVEHAELHVCSPWLTPRSVIWLSARSRRWQRAKIGSRAWYQAYNSHVVLWTLARFAGPIIAVFARSSLRSAS